MPPRIPILQCLRVPTATAPSKASRSFNTSSPAQASTVAQRRKHRDPYSIAQAKARKAANVSRQEVLKKERAARLGDPVRGITTDYIQSFDTATPLGSDQTWENGAQLNFQLTEAELSTAVKHSQWLNTPTPSTQPPSDSEDAPSTESNRTVEDTRAEQEIQRIAEAATAEQAISRIASLTLGSSKDRLRLNTRRCITDFGRHNTDTTLPPRNPSYTTILAAENDTLDEKTPRQGPDTGSSEVQIAILTAKIRTLADFLQGRGRMDKVNKRNLRLLVHRRQKLLRYLERKERGGPRFRNLIEKLGLTEGTWKGEISL